MTMSTKVIKPVMTRATMVVLELSATDVNDTDVVSSSSAITIQNIYCSLHVE